MYTRATPIASNIRMHKFLSSERDQYIRATRLPRVIDRALAAKQHELGAEGVIEAEERMELGIFARHAVGDVLERDLWGAAGPYFAVFARPPLAVFFYALTPRFPCNPAPNA